MGKFDGIYFACDLDGTLLHRENNDISPENVRAIKYFMDEGGSFGFCTGRLPGELAGYDRLVGTNAPAICGNGSLVYDFKKGSYTVVKEAEEDILPFLRYIEKEFPNIMIDVDTPESVFYYRPNSSLKKHQSIADVDFRETEHFSLVPHPWIKLAFWAEPEDVKYLAHHVDKSRLPENYEFHYSFEYCCEITTHGGDKWDAISKNLSLMNNIRTVITAGDNENDVTMLKNADLSFTPANAVDAAKKASGVILSHDCNNSAIAEAIMLLDKKL